MKFSIWQAVFITFVLSFFVWHLMTFADRKIRENQIIEIGAAPRQADAE